MATYNELMTVTVIYFIVCFAVYVALVICAYQLAEKLGRNTFAWTVFSIFCTPILGLLLLHCLGRTEKKIKENFLQELQWKQDFERGLIKVEGE